MEAKNISPNDDLRHARLEGSPRDTQEKGESSLTDHQNRSVITPRRLNMTDLSMPEIVFPSHEDVQDPTCTFPEVASLIPRHYAEMNEDLKKHEYESPWQRLTKSKERREDSETNPLDPSIVKFISKVLQKRAILPSQDAESLLRIKKNLDEMESAILKEYHKRVNLFRANFPPSSFDKFKQSLSDRESEYTRFLASLSNLDTMNQVADQIAGPRPLRIPLDPNYYEQTHNEVEPNHSSRKKMIKRDRSFDSIYRSLGVNAGYEEDITPRQSTQQYMPDRKLHSQGDASSDSSFYSDYEPLTLVDSKNYDDDDQYEDPNSPESRHANYPDADADNHAENAGNYQYSFQGIQARFNKISKKAHKDGALSIFFSAERKKDMMAYYFKIWSEKVRSKTNTYQVAFWPFYVWRRYTRKRRPYHEKALLLSQILNTSILIRYFRPWVRYFKYHSLLLDRMKMLQNTKSFRLLQITWDAWWNWYEPKKGRYRTVHSLAFRRLKARVTMGLYFKALYIYSHYKSIIRRRGLIFIGRVTAPGLPTLPAPSRLKWLHKRFALKDVIHRRISQFRCRKVVPRVFDCWREYIFELRKSRYAFRHWRVKVLRKCIRAWKNIMTISKTSEAESRAQEERLRRSRLDAFTRYVQTLRLIDLGSIKEEDRILEKKIEDLRRRTVLESNRNKELERQMKARDRAFDLYLKEETQRMIREYNKEGEHASNQAMKVRQRVAILFLMKLDVFVDKYRSMQLRKWMRRCFNSLAEVILERKAEKFASRYTLKRLIRICTKIRKFHRKVMHRERVVLIWTTFCAWKDAVDISKTYRSEGELERVRRKKHLLGLHARRAALGHGDEDLRGCFYRWLEWTQFKTARRKICQLANARRLWRIFHHSFLRWRYKEYVLPSLLPQEECLNNDLWLWCDYFGKPCMYRDQVERVAKERKKEIAEALICLPKFRFRRMFDEFESQLEERIRSEQYLLLLHLEDHPVLLPTSKHMDFVRLRSIEIRVVLDHCRAFGLHLMNEKAFQKRYPIMQSENVAFSVSHFTPFAAPFSL
eukprot:TRINITY_DN8962_c0_g1_i2.p1 TRINITY_DN8962_c0_g1~~TRINITY_DN8962_c0_g1_i2.p1  ORF type:complete len:1044 (+),score=162.78 TRINITY_DN8962_c0_g1_i2:62-3193(+)